MAEKPAEVAQLLKALCGGLPAAVAAFGEALKSKERPRPQDDDGTTSEDPLQELIKRFEVASKVILNGVHTAPTRLRWLHPGDFARDSLTRPWLSRLRTVGSL
jgi:hypothetical protein